MAHVNKVFQSCNDPNGTACVDLFCRPDGTYGFELYRRDPEDPRGWAAIGGFGSGVFTKATDLHHAVREAVPWLDVALVGPGGQGGSYV